jgi:carboxylesterase
MLLLHGFTGSPPEMRLVGDYLHRRGLTVSAPLLPGHGTSVDDMNRCTWRDWTGYAEGAWADLRSRCERTFVGGFSMGALIALYLAAQHPELPGAILYAPATLIAEWRIYLTPIFKYPIPKMRKSGESDLTDPEAHLRFWSYDEYPVAAGHELLKLTRQVRRLLPRVTCPLLIIHGIHDRAIHPRSPRYTCERAGSTDKELVTLYNSGHGLVVDSEWEIAARKTFEFVEAHR